MIVKAATLPVDAAIFDLEDAVSLDDKERWHAAELYDEGADEKTVGEYANISKYLAAECSWQAGNTAMGVFGGNGVSVDYHIEKKFRETRLYKVAPISKNLILAYIGHNILGLPTPY